MPNDGEEEQRRCDEPTKDVRTVLPETLAVLIDLADLSGEFLGYVHGVVRVEGPVDPCHVDRRHQDREGPELKTARRRHTKRQLIRIEP